MVALHDVGHPALAGLAVHPDHGLVGAADVLGVDGQVRHRPAEVVDVRVRRVGVDLHGVQALVDRVLVAAGERGVHQVAAVGVALTDRQLVAVLDGAADLVDVGEVDLRVNAAAEQVHAQGHQADVAGALAVAEQATLDAVRPRSEAELGRGDPGAPVVVRVQAEQDRVAPGQVAVHPLDGVGVDVGRGHLDGGRQVQDDRVVRGGRQHGGDRVAHLQCVLQLGAGVALRRVLPAPVRLRLLRRAREGKGSGVGGDRGDRRALAAEHHPALQDRRRVVEVHDGRRGAFAGGEGALDELGPALRQHLDRHVGGDRAVGDDLADEVEVGLARGREADLDLLVTHPHQQVEHAALAGRAHRVDQRLVAVSQVHRAPQRCAVEHDVGPGAVGQHDGGDVLGVGQVAVHRHRGSQLGVPARLVGGSRSGGRADVARGRGERVGRGHLRAPGGRDEGSTTGGADGHAVGPRDEEPVWTQASSRRRRRSARCTRATVDPGRW